MSNDDKLKVSQTESKKKAFKELTIVRDTIFWIDVVGEGQNENAIFALSLIHISEPTRHA